MHDADGAVADFPHPNIDNNDFNDNNNNENNNNNNNRKNNNNSSNKAAFSSTEDQIFKGELTGFNVYNYAMRKECFGLISDRCISNLLSGNVVAWPPDMDNMGDVDLVKGNACVD